MAVKVIVTGGGGFVGKALCFALLERGYEVVSLSRKLYPELTEKGVKSYSLDISQPLLGEQKIFEGAAAIFHTAANVKMWGAYNDFFSTNVIGTKNLLDAARKYRIPKFIYTSSPSVIANGQDLSGVNESLPYPSKYKAFYPRTKARAEQKVLAENGNGLSTIALRPHLIWGPGDNNLIPTILERARQNKLIQIGDGNNLVDVCYIEDCIQAHLRAFDVLESDSKASGKAFFISQGEPVKLWDWVNQVLEYNHLPKIRKKLPAKLAYCLAGVLEGFHRIFCPRVEPTLTQFLVSEMSTEHYFDISRAKELLGYSPKYTIAEGLQKTFSKA